MTVRPGTASGYSISSATGWGDSRATPWLNHCILGQATFLIKGWLGITWPLRNLVALASRCYMTYYPICQVWDRDC